MQKEYKVKAYAPTVKGCGTPDVGWDDARCEDFQKFINSNATEGWSLHSYEYRSVTAKGCAGGKGSWLVCVFEKER